MSDALVRAYLRRRNGIARQHGLTLINTSAEGWNTANTTLSTSLRDDTGGAQLLEKFARSARRYPGGCYADDGESIIALWAAPPQDVRVAIKNMGETLRDKIGPRALFHPGYLPLARHQDWPYLRVQNPNPSPYADRATDWRWCINVKPGLDTSKLESYDFFVGEQNNNGGRVGVFACVEISHQNYNLYHPTVTTQRQLDRVIADANRYAAKLKRVLARYEQAGLERTSYLHLDNTTVRRLWRLP